MISKIIMKFKSRTKIRSFEKRKTNKRQERAKKENVRKKTKNTKKKVGIRVGVLFLS